MVQQAIAEGFSFPGDEEDDSAEILELGAIRKAVCIQGVRFFAYWFDGIRYVEDTTGCMGCPAESCML